MYFLLGLSIVLTALLVCNGIASLFISLAWTLLGRYTNGWSGANRARVVFVLRILPAAAAFAFMLFLLVPAYLAHEPRTNHEPVSWKLALVALVSALGLGLAVIRRIAAWRVTMRLENHWRRHSTPVSFPQLGIDAFRIDHQFPVIAIIGVLRPRLFVADQVLRSLAPEELAATVAHETGHVLARDNLKRGMIGACRDALMTIPCGRALDRAWVEASESAADEYAAARGPRVALDLASALVKVARMIPPGVRPAMPAGAFLIGNDDAGGVKTRVGRLLDLAGNHSTLSSSPANGSGVALWIPIGLAVFMLTLAASKPHVLASVHSLIEHGVFLLK